MSQPMTSFDASRLEVLVYGFNAGRKSRLEALLKIEMH